MTTITNPILRGFNPDPSIVRVGDDYYIATSTFEWFPGVQIHHSRDLVHWRLAARPLNRVSQLDMRGNPDSGGVWAPCLTHHDGLFHLIYTNMKTAGGPWLDSHNYLVTAERIDGDWSDPIYLNSSGFDPSLFHDDDGTKWLVNMLKDHRSETAGSFAGILLQQYSAEQQRLVGPIVNIFAGTGLGFTEGPHLYKRNGYYYLLTAEGGTGYGHAVTLARSKSIEGPYEVHPHNPILTSRDNPNNPLQKAGHADLVATPADEWYLVHLCGRPLTTRGRCVLGRETCIQKVRWGADDWLYLEPEGREPALTVPAPSTAAGGDAGPTTTGRDDFDEPTLGPHYQTLRRPLGPHEMSLTERRGFLRLYGGESLSSWHDQVLVARRREAFVCSAETSVEFNPITLQHMAGLVCFYNTRTFYYLHLTHDDRIGRCLSLIACRNGEFAFPLTVPLDEGAAPASPCRLRATMDHARLQFSYSSDGVRWGDVGEVLDGSALSDDAVSGWSFTGTFVGMCCQDLSGSRLHADFGYFDYQEQ